ncbi:MAG: 50S ribosomal protein L10 [Novosphingobium sp.]|nr:50S ribosomal protein L10 [Novosphingobium sp.]
MNRQDKQLIIENIKNEFNNSSTSFIVGMQGLTVANVQDLRRSLQSKGAKFKVAKNTLLKKAAQDLNLPANLDEHFKKQIAVVFAKDDIAEVAKILSKAAKSNNKLVLIAGSLDNRMLNTSQIEFLASLPPQDVLRAQVVGTIQAPIRGLATVLNQTILKLLFAIKAIAEKK